MVNNHQSSVTGVSRADELWQQGFDRMQRQEYPEAVRLLQQALALDRQQGAGLSLEIMLYLAEAYKLNNQLWLAADMINKACHQLAREQNRGTAEFQLRLRMRQGEYNRAIGNIPKALEGYSQAVELYGQREIWKRSDAYGSWLLTLACLDVTAREMQAACLGYNKLFAGNRALLQSGSGCLPGRREGRKKIRLGYLSADFRQHVMFSFYYVMLQGYNRERFEVTCYSLGEKADGYTEHLKTLVDGWQDVQGKSLPELAEIIRQDGIDILVDLSGHSSGSALPVFALRPAPVQVSGLGWMESTGFSCTDYLLTDRYLEGFDGEYEQYLAEKPFYLTSQFCYTGRSDVPEPAGAPCRGKGYVTFGSFNAYYKLTPEVVELWSRILQLVPESRLLLKCYAFIDGRLQRELMGRFARWGIGNERLLLEPATTGYMNRYLEVDIALDTYPYTGGGTTLDALYMGVPVISMHGERRSSRFGLSILSNAGLGMLAAASPEEYIGLATGLAHDWQLLDELHFNLRLMLQASDIMNGKKYMQELETGYENIMAKYNSRET